MWWCHSCITTPLVPPPNPLHRTATPTTAMMMSCHGQSDVIMSLMHHHAPGATTQTPAPHCHTHRDHDDVMSWPGWCHDGILASPCPKWHHPTPCTASPHPAPHRTVAMFAPFRSKSDAGEGGSRLQAATQVPIYKWRPRQVPCDPQRCSTSAHVVPVNETRNTALSDFVAVSKEHGKYGDELFLAQVNRNQINVGCTGHRLDLWSLRSMAICHGLASTVLTAS